MTLVAPTECRDTPSASWIERHLASNGAVRRVISSTSASRWPTAADRPALGSGVRPGGSIRFLVDEARLDRLATLLVRPNVEISSADVQSPALVDEIEQARGPAECPDLAELN
jgi:hypothetical protein